MQLAQFAYGFLVELFGIGRFVEIEVTAENFIGSFAGKYHFHAHRFDDAGEEVHRGTGTDGGYIVGLDVVNHVADGIQSFLHGEVDFVVHGADVFCYDTGSG
ncbi:hypothetical protein SDC9_52792 [bioreactor metagenome]|uniref:Uncharacterized protein n=1 Tax=bioreactor metagenome TaxID=1076179 RepID=A0A644WSK0_9ZZZZ